MKFVRLSATNIINLDLLTRLEIYKGDMVQYATLFFDSGENYRCTEEESIVLMEAMERELGAK